LELAWDIHPSARNCYAEVAKEFPGIGIIANKLNNGETSVDYEMSYRSKYFITCHKSTLNLEEN